MEVLSRMALFSSIGTIAIVEVIKVSVGRPRPNFYALHVGTDDDKHKAAISFPSGHSAISFSMLFLLTLNLYSSMQYVQEKFKNRKPVRLSIDIIHSYFFIQIWWSLRYYLLLSVLLVFLPTFLAMYIACTRLTDYWHDYADVLAGSLLGIGGAILSFIVYKDQLHYKYAFEV